MPAAPPPPAGWTPTSALPLHDGAAAARDAAPPPRFERLAVIGCGLIGGSFALAARRAGVVGEIVGAAKDAATLDAALAARVIDRAAPDAAHAARQADLVVVAVPLSAVETTLRTIAPVLRGDALVMDVGSTKRDVVDAARRTLGDRFARFVAAHPIAGSERSGVEHAHATLFDDRLAIVTPLAATDATCVAQAQAVWQALGARVATMAPEHHDEAFAAVSHLPHLLAFAYMGAITNQPAGPEFLALAGPGFRDFTRIAAGDATVWRDILLANREQVLKQSQRFRYALEAFERALLAGDRDTVEALVLGASVVRSGWQIGGAALPASTQAAAEASAAPDTDLAGGDTERMAWPDA